MIDLQITQRFGKIGLDINDARYKLNQQEPDLQVKQIKPDVYVRTSDANLEIDYSPRLESMGIGGVWFMIGDLSNKCETEYQQNLETTVQTGRQIGKIENNVSIGDVVFNAVAPPEYSVTLAPLAPIRISYLPAEVHSNAELGDVKYTADMGTVSIAEFTFPSVHAFLEQKPYLEIKAVGQSVDLRK